MRYRCKSLEELEEIEQDLRDQEGIGRNDGFYGKLIDLYEEMYRVAVKREKETRNQFDRDCFIFIKRQLIKSLVLYGTYIKMANEKNDGNAEITLKKVLNYDSKNPIAYYRLGFLAYKSRRFHKSCHYFQKAIEYHTYEQNQEWPLNEQQLYHAHLYLVNSSLFIAKETNEKMKSLFFPEQPLKQYNLSPLFEMINDNDNYLSRHAFVKHTNEGHDYCSKEDCDTFYESNTHENLLILYFSDRESVVRYNDTKNTMNATYARMLKDFLLKSSAEESLLKRDLHDHFDKGEVKDNTYIQKVRRLREKLRVLQIPEVIESDLTRTKTAYFYNGKIPFTVMERVEESID